MAHLTFSCSSVKFKLRSNWDTFHLNYDISNWFIDCSTANLLLDSYTDVYND